MFVKACLKIRESVYGLFAFTQKPGVREIAVASTGTAFMIAPEIIVTAAHLTHIDNDLNKPNLEKFVVIRAPDVKQSMEDAELIAEDPFRDIALLRIKRPRSSIPVVFEKNIVLPGASYGSLGFPLAKVDLAKLEMNFLPRFQGGHVSIYGPHKSPQGSRNIYETDSIIYGGSSGSPGFLVNGNVFGVLIGTLMRLKPGSDVESSRLAIVLWTPSMDIIDFANRCGITI